MEATQTYSRPVDIPEFVPTLDDLKKAFEVLSQSTYEDVQGVMRVDAANHKPGPVVGITIGTHGNEIVGLTAFAYHLKYGLENLLQRGSVIFVINHLEGFKRLFESGDFGENRRIFRYFDADMNRLPDEETEGVNILELREDTRYEVRRVLELAPIFAEFTAGMDIHETKADPFLGVVSGDVMPLLQGVNINTIITGLPSAQRGIPVSALYGGIENDTIPVFVLEASRAIRSSIISVMRIFLQNLGVFPGKPPKTTNNVKCYPALEEVFFPNPTYRFAREFPPFGAVKKDEIIAEGDGEPITAPRNGYILFATSNNSLERLNLKNDSVYFFAG